jgi:predicted  nucleic acid-binding Zn-ribbon protein
MEQIRKLTNQNEKLKKDLSDLEAKHEYEKQELYSIIEQLREDVNELDQTKKLYIGIILICRCP